MARLRRQLVPAPATAADVRCAAATARAAESNRGCLIGLAIGGALLLACGGAVSFAIRKFADTVEDVVDGVTVGGDPLFQYCDDLLEVAPAERTERVGELLGAGQRTGGVVVEAAAADCQASISTATDASAA